MANTVRIAYSNTAGNTPSALGNGVLAVNQADGKLFYRASSGTVTQLASGGGGGGSTAPGTVTIPASGDPQWGSVVCLLAGNGSLTDSSIYGRVFTAYGGAAATGAAKVGSASLTFDGDGDYLKADSSPSLSLGSNYTVECWVRPASSTVSGGIAHIGNYETSNGSWDGLQFSLRALGSYFRFYFWGTSNSTEQYIDIAQSYFPANTWTHLAVVRSGTTGYVFANGAVIGTINDLNAPPSTLQPLYVGAWPLTNSGVLAFSGYWNGQIDELRITTAARYTSAFTPTESAYPTGFYSAAQTLAITVTGSGGSISDGNKGDITVSSSAATWTINNPPIHPFLLMGG